VLDFGLAKAAAIDARAPTLTESRDGALFGTASYMSPEQARSHSVDKRTDIWAFGCVLYEMLTGRQAFPGDTVSDTIAGILEREPDWTALPAATPKPTRRLLIRCLTKTLTQRLRDVGDVRIELDAIDDGLPGLRGEPASTHAAAKTRARWLPWAALVALAAGAGIWEASRPATIDDPLAHAQFTRFTDWDGTEEAAEISPDGKVRGVPRRSRRRVRYLVEPGRQPVFYQCHAGHPSPRHPADRSYENSASLAMARRSGSIPQTQSH
jgi:hypothetical protein